jgi:hypothetical protein
MLNWTTTDATTAAGLRDDMAFSQALQTWLKKEAGDENRKTNE